MLKNFKIFIALKPKKYKVEKLSVGHIYIYRNPNSTECLRVKYISAFSNAHVVNFILSKLNIF